MKQNIRDTLFTKKRGLPEVVTLIVYILGVSVISCFHEPWFDEAQAWEIARCASLKEILFHIPHYEGHPQLWHLILMPFAKSGAPFEFTLSAVNITFCAAGMALLLFVSPFPRIVRCALPFSFFFFYQYGVISRPYSLMTFAVFLCAMTYTDRSEKPLRYVLSLILLCAAQAFGIVLAGGLCIVWLSEIFAQHKSEGSLISVFKDKRCYCLLLIASVAAFLIASIIPAKDVYFQGVDYSVGERLAMLYKLLVIPIDGLFGVYLDIEAIKQSTSGLIATSIGGAIILAAMIAICRANKKTLTFALPYFMFTLFGSLSYFSYHHLGISLLYFIFIFWIIIAENGEIALPKFAFKIKEKVDSMLIRRLAAVTAAVIIAVPFGWTVYCCVQDILKPFGPRAVAEYIKENHLEDKIMLQWHYEYKNIPEDLKNQMGADMSEYYTAQNRSDYTNLIGYGSTLSAYFDRNVFYNFNAAKPQDMYMYYKYPSDSEVKRDLELWKKHGYPEYMMWKCYIDKMFPELPEDFFDEMYEEIARFDTHMFFKFSDEKEVIIIYKLKDEYKTK